MLASARLGHPWHSDALTKIHAARNALFASIIFVLSFAGAQAPTSSFSVAYVNSEYLLSLHPLYPEIVALEEQARTEVTDLNGRIQQLLAKNQSPEGLTPDEQDLLSVSMSTLGAIRARYDAEIMTLAQPALDEVTNAVAETAGSLGIVMVFDYRVAFEAGLIVYADPETDITGKVEELLLLGE